MTGGGQGMLTRLYGLAIDQITAIDVVLASGVAVTATGTNSYSDLFWALRGAGSASFGVVTRFTVNIFKVPQNAVFYLTFKKSIRILQLWQTFFVDSPNELNAYVHLQNNLFNMYGHYLGSLDNLKTILAPILADSALTSSQLKSCTLMEARSFVRDGENMASTAPIDNTEKGPQKSKSEFIGQLLPDAVLQNIVNTVSSAQSIYYGGHAAAQLPPMPQLTLSATLGIPWSTVPGEMLRWVMRLVVRNITKCRRFSQLWRRIPLASTITG